jgi:hypothetical protein
MNLVKHYRSIWPVQYEELPLELFVMFARIHAHWLRAEARRMHYVYTRKSSLTCVFFLYVGRVKVSQCDVARIETSRYNDPDLKKLYGPAAILDDRSYVTYTSQCLKSKSIALHCFTFPIACVTLLLPLAGSQFVPCRKHCICIENASRLMFVRENNRCSFWEPYETYKYKCLGSGTCMLLTTGLLIG